MRYPDSVLRRFRSSAISYTRHTPATPAEAALAAAGYLGGHYHTTERRDRPWDGSTGEPPPPPPA